MANPSTKPPSAEERYDVAWMRARERLHKDQRIFSIALREEMSDEIRAAEQAAAKAARREVRGEVLEYLLGDPAVVSQHGGDSLITDERWLDSLVFAIKEVAKAARAECAKLLDGMCNCEGGFLCDYCKSAAAIRALDGEDQDDAG